jgi:hypothetical protein
MKKFNLIIDSEIFFCDITISEKRILPYLKKMRKHLASRRAKLYLAQSSEWNHKILSESPVLDKRTWGMLKRRAGSEKFMPVKVAIKHIAA